MTLFVRLLDAPADLKGQLLRQAVNGDSGRAFQVDPVAFEQIPGSPFAYWVSDRVREIFRRLPAFEADRRTAKQGLATADDFRFVRTWWEVDERSVGERWFGFAKGGSYSPFYADVSLVVNWAGCGAEICSFVDPKTGKTYSRPQNTEFYFQPGLTWPLRGVRLSAQAVPAQCVFSIAGKMAFTPLEELPACHALMNSSAFGFLVRVRSAAPFAALTNQSFNPRPSMSRGDALRSQRAEPPAKYARVARTWPRTSPPVLASIRESSQSLAKSIA